MVMSVYPFIYTLISIMNGRLLLVWWFPLTFALGLLLLWAASRRGTFIAVDTNSRSLRASNFFIRTKPIPIESIIRIGTRGMFVGAATEIEITYRKPNGGAKDRGLWDDQFSQSDGFEKGS
jgi:hypothetical protein